MVKCKQCNREMKTAKGCDERKFSYVSLGLKIYKRKLYERSSHRCHDCGAVSGHLHHDGCDWEFCPKCGGQLLSCNCAGKYPSYIGTKAGLLQDVKGLAARKKK